MYVYAYVCMYFIREPCMRAYVQAYIRAQIHLFSNRCTYKYKHTFAHRYIYSRTGVHIDTKIICECMHTHTYTIRRKLTSKGLKADARGYMASFRVNARSPAEEILLQVRTCVQHAITTPKQIMYICTFIHVQKYTNAYIAWT